MTRPADARGSVLELARGVVGAVGIYGQANPQGGGSRSPDLAAVAAVLSAIDAALLHGHPRMEMYGPVTRTVAAAFEVSNTDLGNAAHLLADLGYLQRPTGTRSTLDIDGAFRVSRVVGLELVDADKGWSGPAPLHALAAVDLVGYLDAALRTSQTKTVEYLLRLRHGVSRRPAVSIARRTDRSQLGHVARLLAAAAPVNGKRQVEILLAAVLNPPPVAP